MKYLLLTLLAVTILSVSAMSTAFADTDQELTISINDNSHWGHTNFSFWNFLYVHIPSSNSYGFIIVAELEDQTLDELKDLVQVGKAITRMQIVDYPENSRHITVHDLKDCMVTDIFGKDNANFEGKNTFTFSLEC